MEEIKNNKGNWILKLHFKKQNQTKQSKQTTSKLQKLQGIKFTYAFFPSGNSLKKFLKILEKQ